MGRVRSQSVLAGESSCKIERERILVNRALRSSSVVVAAVFKRGLVLDEYRQ
jgi:hypothetical protein